MQRRIRATRSAIRIRSTPPLSRPACSRGMRRIRLRSGQVVGVFLLTVLTISCGGGPALQDVALTDPCQAVRSGTQPFEGADPTRGEARFQSDCAQCHSLSESRAGRPGPHLNAIVFRQIGDSAYYGYSEGFRDRQDTWTLWALDRYIEDPQAFIAGTRMRYPGLPDPAARIDLLAYLACEGIGSSATAP